MGEKYLSDIPGIHIRSGWKDAEPAGGPNQDFPLMRAEEEMEVKEIYYHPQSAITGADATAATIEVKRHRSGEADVVVASKQFLTGVDVVALEAIALELSSTEANLRLEAGDTLYSHKTELGDGMELPKGRIYTGFEFKKAPTS